VSERERYIFRIRNFMITMNIVYISSAMYVSLTVEVVQKEDSMNFFLEVIFNCGKTSFPVEEQFCPPSYSNILTRNPKRGIGNSQNI
jgi:hypothetical protein